jgi:hypothetical protein
MPFLTAVSDSLDRNSAVNSFAGIRRIAVPWWADMLGCFDDGAAFECHPGDEEHEQWRMCPEELAAFVDYFAELQLKTFYVI